MNLAAQAHPAYRAALKLLDIEPHDLHMFGCEFRRDHGVAPGGHFFYHKYNGVTSTSYVTLERLRREPIDPWWTFLWRCHPPVPEDIWGE